MKRLSLISLLLVLVSNVSLADVTKGSAHYKGTVAIDGNTTVGTTTAGGDRLRVVGGITRASRADTTPVGTASTSQDDLVLGSTDTANTGMTIFGTSFTNINFGDVASNNVGFIAYDHGSDTMRFAAAGTSDRLTVNSTGILLPTPGGTAATLTGYEEYIHNTTWNLGGTANNSPSIAVKITKLGKIVVMCGPPIQVTGAAGAQGGITMTSAIPSRFRPGFTFLIAGSRVLNASVTQAGPGGFVCDVTGTFTITRDFSNPSLTWGTSGTNGYQNDWCITYNQQ